MGSSRSAANDIDRIEHALDVFHQTKDRPTFIILDSHIGYGSRHRQDIAGRDASSKVLNVLDANEAGGDGARRRGARLDLRLGALRQPEIRPYHWHAYIRCVGSAQGVYP